MLLKAFQHVRIVIPFFDPKPFHSNITQHTYPNTTKSMNFGYKSSRSAGENHTK
jgi:hypothetical protein